jgi:hypothetical protein
VFSHVLFVRVVASDVMVSFPDVGLPVLMIYRGGRCLTDAIRCTEALPHHFTDVDVARLLQSQRVLTLPDGEAWMQRKTQQRQEEQQRKSQPFTINRAGNSDDDDDD